MPRFGKRVSKSPYARPEGNTGTLAIQKHEEEVHDPSSTAESEKAQQLVQEPNKTDDAKGTSTLFDSINFTLGYNVDIATRQNIINGG